MIWGRYRFMVSALISSETLISSENKITNDTEDIPAHGYRTEEKGKTSP